MKKVRSNALWTELTEEQRKTLDQWLFDENLSYAKALPRAQSELGFKGEASSLKRYFARRQQEKLVPDIKETVMDAVEIQKLGVEPDAARKAGMMVMGAHFFRLVREAPEKVKEWAPVASLLVQNDHNEAWREIKGEEQKIRREALEFTKEKFEMDMVEQALMALPDLIELAKARRNPEPDAYAENALLNRARRKMFGVVWEVRPESAEEDAAMKSREAGKAGEGQGKEEPKLKQEKTEATELAEPVPGSAHYEEYVEWRKKRENVEPKMEENIQQPTSNVQHPFNEKGPSPNSQAPERKHGENGKLRMEDGGEDREGKHRTSNAEHRTSNAEHRTSNGESPAVNNGG